MKISKCIFRLTVLIFSAAVFFSCQSIASSVLLDSYREAGFSRSFINEKEREIEKVEEEYRDEYEKQHTERPKGKSFSNGVTIRYINGRLLSKGEKKLLNNRIENDIITQTGQNVYFSSESDTIYSVEIYISQEEDSAEHYELYLNFYHLGRFTRSYTVTNRYELNKVEKEVPFADVSRIVSGYIVMVIQNDQHKDSV